mgnify:CR=1 FL=1
MSIVQKLTEGIVNRDMKQEGQALLDKWTQTGLLEGLQNQHQKQNMARLLENQAKELLRESSAMGGGDVEGFAAVAFPIVRRVFAGLLANDIVSVQPMSLPSGLIFFLDFVYSPNQGDGGTATMPRFGNSSDKSIYGTNDVGSEIIDGVSLINDTTKAGFGGPGRDGSFGGTYGSPRGTNVATIASDTTDAVLTTFVLDGAVSEANAKLIQYDADLLASTDSSLGVLVLDVGKQHLESIASADDADFDNVTAFQIDVLNSGIHADGDAAVKNWMDDIAAHSGITSGSVSAGSLVQIRRLTKALKNTDSTLASDGGAAVRFVMTGTRTGGGDLVIAAAAAGTVSQMAAGVFSFPIIDKLQAGGSLGSINTSSNNYGLEGSANIPEIDIKVDSTAITAQTKKLKAKWTPELGQDLNAYHNLDAEVELTSILSEQIALEIDREILADLVNGATAGTYYWSRSPGLFVNRQTGAELGATAAAPDFTGTVSEWYETLIETINDVSAQIHRKTLRGGANFVVCSPEVANILEFTSGFRANVTADADKGEIGAVKVGSLSRKFDVMVDPYFPRNVVLVGRRGNSFLESGYVYAPYVPLQTTPTIFGPEDFVPRKGVMTRYAKKMVRSDMYGLVIVRGLSGESGSS